MTDNNFEYIATRILKEQAKLGKIKKISVSIKDFSEAKRKTLIKSGLVGVALLSTAVLRAFMVSKKTKQG